jgi:hypothetical protein
MKKRLQEKTEEGFEGWDEKHLQGDMAFRLLMKSLVIYKDDYKNNDYPVTEKKLDLVDIANFALLLATNLPNNTQE